MTYAPHRLQPLAKADEFTLWRYGAPVPIEQLLREINYFLPAKNLLRLGDMMLVQTEGVPYPDAAVLTVCRIDDDRVDVRKLC